MKLKEMVTNINISKQLAELGVSQRADDYFYWYKRGDKWGVDFSKSGAARLFFGTEYRAFTADELIYLINTVDLLWRADKTKTGLVVRTYSNGSTFVGGASTLADSLGIILIEYLKK